MAGARVQGRRGQVIKKQELSSLLMILQIDKFNSKKVTGSLCLDPCRAPGHKKE